MKKYPDEFKIGYFVWTKQDDFRRSAIIYDVSLWCAGMSTSFQGIPRVKGELGLLKRQALRLIPQLLLGLIEFA